MAGASSALDVYSGVLDAASPNSSCQRSSNAHTEDAHTPSNESGVFVDEPELRLDLVDTGREVGAYVDLGLAPVPDEPADASARHTEDEQAEASDGVIQEDSSDLV